MTLFEFVISELSTADLQGVILKDVVSNKDAVVVTYELNQMAVDFSATENGQIQLLSLLANGQIFTDEATLGGYKPWAEFVWAFVGPVTKRYVPTATVSVTPIATPIAQPVAAKSLIFSLSEEPKPQQAVKVATPIVGESSLDEAIASAHKDGYKAARKKNMIEMRKLKKKYQMALFFTVFGMLLLFALVLMFHETITDLFT